ncbi:MAG: prephenate dehydrogenase/arogenate dehydrogenase family protein [Thermaerobacter sp.]|nr:prephenate dehydrogenase/arogenate dehydrogenase family protein [Thermaerobacter sp.]
MLAERVAIVGVGLVGGSLGMALRRKGLCRQVVGVDTSRKVLEQARAAGAIDAGGTDLARGLAGAELVVLAAPVAACLELLPRVAPLLAPGAVLTDVASTKGAILERAAAVLRPGQDFVGGHPMSGSEKSGLAGADPFLFQDAPYLLVPAPGCSPAGVAKVRSMAEGVGARPRVLEAAQHDRAVAAVSHLPHLTAAALVNAVAAGEEDGLELAGGGLRDTTRVAGGDPALWREILATNAAAAGEALEGMMRELEAFRRDLAQARWHELEERLRRAQQMRRRIPRGRGIRPELAELVVVLPDRPGAIGQVCSRLGEAGINIADAELLRVEEGEGGTLRLGFAAEAEAAEAARLLAAHGYRALRR